MKKYKLIFLVLVIAFLSSCEDKLNLVPISDLTTGNFYNTEEQIGEAVVGMYNGMRGLYTVNKPNMAQSPSDDITQLYMNNVEGSSDISKYITSSSNYEVLNYWQAAYQAIYRCNIVIEKSEGVIFANPATKERYIGEAKFLRSLIYFDMVRFFGGVPLMTKIVLLEDAYKVGRATKEETWAQVKADLNAAVSVLPVTDITGRATKFSALGILADVNLNLGEYAEAKVAIDQVINSGKYDLFSNFADVYKDANNNGKESIFAIQFLNQTGEGNPYPTNMVPHWIDTKQWPFGGNGLELTPSENLWNAYSPGDKRRDLTLKNSWIDGKNGYLNVDSYYQVKEGINNKPFAIKVWGINQIIMRYAEVLLISAEVENKLGNSAKAVVLINRIRNRAGLTNFSSTNQNDIHEEVYLQRRLELAFEDERWFDIQRSGKAAAILAPFTAGTSYPYSETYALFPIPQTEIGKVETGILKQNPGY